MGHKYHSGATSPPQRCNNGYVPNVEGRMEKTWLRAERRGAYGKTKKFFELASREQEKRISVLALSLVVVAFFAPICAGRGH